MLFNTASFALFLATVLLALRLAPVSFRAPVLLGASIVFYAMWVPAYLLLLLVSLLVNYVLLRAMVRSDRPRLHLIASVTFTLGLLGYFKYAAMLVTTLLPVLERVAGATPGVPDLILPLGISFYSFQIIALAVDTYRRQIEPIDSLSRYCLFISFFPQLIAGPILRGSQLLPQLERGGEPTPERTRRGLWLLVIGLGKKAILADFLLAPFVDGVFAEHAPASWTFNLIALYSFAFQIYFDFSGYTDMARGMALLMGFELPFNFMEPYLSRNPAEFWRRWHITLSQWLRDYLYVPLGGNRGGSARTQRNLMITMLLGGLWHGASWNFVIWGGLHGLLLVGYRMIQRGPERGEGALEWRDLPRIVLLFQVVCLIWVFFRAPTFDGALQFLSTLFGLQGNFGWPVVQCAVVALCVALHVVERVLRTHWSELQARSLRWPWAGALEGSIAGVILTLSIAVSEGGSEFIYFQF